MAQNNTSAQALFTNKFFDFNSMKNFAPAAGLFPFDFGNVLETMRKNMQAMTEAQQIAIENIQAIAQRQAEIMTQMVEDNTSLAQQIMTEGTPEEKISRQADLARKSYERSMSNLTELSDMVVKSNREAGEIISKRVTASLTEFKSSFADKGAAKGKTVVTTHQTAVAA